MAYMNQDRKKELAPAIKAVLKEYGMKATIAVRNHSTLVVNIKRGPIDFGEYTHGDGYIQVNTYHIERHYEGVAREFLLKLKDAMMAGNWDKSDIQSDYFNVGWWIDINVGGYAKPYEYNGPEAIASSPAPMPPAAAPRHDAEEFHAEGVLI